MVSIDKQIISSCYTKRFGGRFRFVEIIATNNNSSKPVRGNIHKVIPCLRNKGSYKLKEDDNIYISQLADDSFQTKTFEIPYNSQFAPEGFQISFSKSPFSQESNRNICDTISKTSDFSKQCENKQITDDSFQITSSESQFLTAATNDDCYISCNSNDASNETENMEKNPTVFMTNMTSEILSNSSTSSVNIMQFKLPDSEEFDLEPIDFETEYEEEYYIGSEGFDTENIEEIGNNDVVKEDVLNEKEEKNYAVRENTYAEDSQTEKYLGIENIQTSYPQKFEHNQDRHEHLRKILADDTMEEKLKKKVIFEEAFAISERMHHIIMEGVQDPMKRNKATTSDLTGFKFVPMVFRHPKQLRESCSLTSVGEDPYKFRRHLHSYQVNF